MSESQRTVTEAQRLLSEMEGCSSPAAPPAGGSTVAALGTLPNVLAGSGSRSILKKRKKKQENPLQEGRKKLNLDKMDPDGLMAIWDKSQRVAFARLLFPDMPKGYVRATKNIGHLAANLASAKKYPRNTEYQRTAFDIWHRLPGWAKEIIRVRFR